MTVKESKLLELFRRLSKKDQDDLIVSLEMQIKHLGEKGEI